jgi:transcriptional regulator with XRE-family HTH domain
MVGNVIKQKRELAGYTQTEIANKLGIGPNAVCKWEAEVNVPKLKYLLPLAQMLDISMADLLEVQPCQPPKK